MVRVIVPSFLRTLAKIAGEVELEVAPPVTPRSVLDALEERHPSLRGTIRDHVTKERRPLVRYYACSEDFSTEPADTRLPAEVASGKEPFIIVASIAGG